MPVTIDDVTQLGVGWEIQFRPADQAEALRDFLAGRGLRIVSMRRESRPDGEVGLLECEQPRADVSKLQLLDLLKADPTFDLSGFQNAPTPSPSTFADEG